MDFEYKPTSHWVSIRVFTRFGNGELLEELYWGNLRFEIRTKYDWYFKYRAALMQVKYPKRYVEFLWGNQKPTGKTLVQILRNKLIRKKGKITEFTNKKNRAEAKYDELFPIEQHPVYVKFLEKLNRLKVEKDILEKELDYAEKNI